MLLPRVASVLSAWGMLATELRIEAMRSHVGDTAAIDLAALREVAELVSLGFQSREQPLFTIRDADGNRTVYTDKEAWRQACEQLQTT